MAKQKVTISVDRNKVDQLEDLLHIGSTSGVIAFALDELLRQEQVRRDVAAYRRAPLTMEEEPWPGPVDDEMLADDTDWEALYAEDDGAA